MISTFQPFDFLQHIGPDFRQALHVGAQNGKSSLPDPPFQDLLSEIEFVVPRHQGVNPQGVHHPDNRFPLKKIGPLIALDHISGGQKQRRLSNAQPVDLFRQVELFPPSPPYCLPVGAVPRSRENRSGKVSEVESPAPPEPKVPVQTTTDRNKHQNNQYVSSFICFSILLALSLSL